MLYYLDTVIVDALVTAKVWNSFFRTIDTGGSGS